MQLSTINRDSLSGTSGVLRVASLGLGALAVGYGTYMHLSIRAIERADAAAPWHPLFVIAPLVVGVLLILAGLLSINRQ